MLYNTHSILIKWNRVVKLSNFLFIMNKCYNNIVIHKGGINVAYIYP